MNQKMFALIWGRRMFFGLVWPLLMILGFLYFKHQSFPKNVVETIYLVSSCIGLYGLITATLYFFLYAPFAFLFPTYYKTRLWSLLIIISVGLVMFFDSILWTKYGMHLNKFFLDLVMAGLGKDVFQIPQSVLIIAGSVLLAVIFYFWFQGERHWRHMQRKFNNKNANWYLVVILIFSGISLLIGQFGTRFSSVRIGLFSQNFPIPLPYKIEAHNGNEIHSSALSCSSSENPHLVFLLVNNWESLQINEENYPYLSHLKSHGLLTSQHKSLNENVESGLFSIFYGLPAIYKNGIMSSQARPLFFSELEKRNYQIHFFQESESDNSKLSKLLLQGDSKTEKIQAQDLEAKLSQLNFDRPTFLMLNLDFKNPSDLENQFQTMINEFSRREVSQDTLFILTGVNSKPGEFLKTSPFFILSQKLKERQLNIESSHVDIVPTLLKEVYQCEDLSESFVLGKSMFDLSPRDYLIGGENDNFFVVDEMKKQILEINPLKGFLVKDFSGTVLPKEEARIDLLLEILEKRLDFTKSFK